MKITLKERAGIAGYSKNYYERAKIRKDSDKIIDKTIELVLKKIREMIK